MEQTWTRDYFAEDDGEMVPRTSHTAAFPSGTKDRGPPVQSQIWRSGEKVPFVQTYSLRAFEKPPQQQVALLDLQSALFCCQLEIQKLQRVVRQKERQLANAKQCVQFVEAAAHESEQQKEASWKHNQELRKALQQLQ
ncbi:PDE4DIP isoform 29, partial [Pongo abelii]